VDSPGSNQEGAANMKKWGETAKWVRMAKVGVKIAKNRGDNGKSGGDQEGIMHLTTSGVAKLQSAPRADNPRYAAGL